MALTIGEVATKFGLSRSTLLYYDRKGLLRPKGRSGAGYRLYSDADLARLGQIRTYRDMGLSLQQIMSLLDGRPGSLLELLDQRLLQLHREIGSLRKQEQLILELLKDSRALRKSRFLDKETWVAILRSSGMSDADMTRWHQQFEASAPDAHQDFRESLAIPKAEITNIRKRSRT